MLDMNPAIKAENVLIDLMMQCGQAVESDERTINK
jgi:hypothetical protein